MMKKYTTLVIFVLSSAQLCFGRFSKFINITPPTQQEHNITVSISPEKNESYTVSFLWKNSSKHCWLIVFKEGDAPKTQRNFRDFIWNKNLDMKSVEKIEPLLGNTDGVIELKLAKEAINRSFIIIDFPQIVFDGGFFYTIDLPEFFEAIEK
jgi:hypothetical protein